MSRRLLLMYAWRGLKAWISAPVILARLKKKYPNCHFYPGSSVDDLSVLGNYNVIFRNASIINSVLGDHTFVQKNSVIINADIGKFCSIAAGVSISLGKHPLKHVSSHPAFYSATQPLAKTFSSKDRFEPFDRRTTVGNDVWIGQGATVMDGVKIGTGAVVAAGAIVTKDIPEYAIAAGIPAKILRYRFDQETIQQLLETSWWDMDEKRIGVYAPYFSEPETFLKIWGKNKKCNP
ncbi:MAG: CatB-related O-acetyltransferase [Pseudomonadota bacterium]